MDLHGLSTYIYIKMHLQPKPRLRCCTQCKFIFKRHDKKALCPLCSSESDGALQALGNDCYKLANTQEPWKQKKLQAYEAELNEIIKQQLPLPKGYFKRLLGFNNE